MRSKKISKQNLLDFDVSLDQKNPFTQILYSLRYYELLHARQKLPVFKSRQKFLKTLELNDIVIVQGDTGSGKSTQIPQFLMESEIVSKGKIAVTQNQGIAAISLAKRVCEETDTNLGEIVGYQVQFQERSSPSTLLKFMTEGMLIQELIADRNLLKYSAVVLDEVH